MVQAIILEDTYLHHSTLVSISLLADVVFEVVHGLCSLLCRYNVYQDLTPQAAFLKLADNGVHLYEAQASYAQLQVSSCLH